MSILMNLFECIASQMRILDHLDQQDKTSQKIWLVKAYAWFTQFFIYLLNYLLKFYLLTDLLTVELNKQPL